MEVSAKLLHARLSTQKCRLVADQIRGMAVGSALDLLTYSTKKSARFIKEVLQSAIANAENNHGADVDELRVSKVYVDKGPMFKRMRPRAKGRSARIIKPTCHITVELSDQGSK